MYIDHLLIYLLYFRICYILFSVSTLDVPLSLSCVMFICLRDIVHLQHWRKQDNVKTEVSILTNSKHIHIAKLPQ